MQSIPSESQAFAGLLRHLFPGEDAPAVTLRDWQLSGGPHVTVTYLADLAEARDVQALVLEPLFRAESLAAPHRLLHSGRFPASHLEAADRVARLQDGLLAGLIGVHVEGYPETLLVGSGQPSFLPDAFGADMGANRALLLRVLRSPDLRFVSVHQPNGNRAVVAYLAGAAGAETVKEVVEWARQQSPWPSGEPGWQALLNVFRLPRLVELPSPGMAAEVLRRGYVAVLFDYLPGVHVAPVTFEILLAGSDDIVLPTSLRRVAVPIRYLLALIALTVGGIFTAVTAYHHAMLPGPFLVALSSARQAPALPVIMEILLVQWLDDGLWAAALRMGGRRWTLFGGIGTILGAMAGFQAGLLSPIPAVIGIVSVVCLQALPTPDLTRRLRLWRNWFVLAGAALGMYGAALLGFGLIAYLAEEHHFGHRLRQKPGGVYR